MNKTHRIVWSTARQAYIVAHEAAGFGGRPGTTLALSLALLLGAGAAAATPAATELPTGGQVVAGQASISSSGARLDVQQSSQRAALDWQTFNIGSQAQVHFEQPAAGVALNRVLDTHASQIYGRLTATGQVFLLNPNGVLFAPGSQVDVGGLVASTLQLSNADFMAGNYRFEGGSSSAIINQGNIRAAQGGTVALIAARIENTGSIEAAQGNVLLGAGSRVTLDLGGPVKLQVEQGALDALIANGGAIRAAGGLVYLTAQAAGALASTAINHSGLIEAQTLATGERGEVLLSATGPGSRVEVSGRIDTQAATGVGGKVDITAPQVWVQGSAQIDTRGSAGGGNVRVGGGWLGQDTDMANALEVQVDAGARTDSSATANGNAGTVVFWSDDAMRFAGHIQATGGQQGGDGGMVEVSGKERLAFSGSADTSAAQGQGGLLLLDPTNLTILNGSAGTQGNTGNWASGTDMASYNIAEATLEALTGNVVLRATNTLTINNLADGVLNLANASLEVFAGNMTNQGTLEIRTNGNQIYHTPLTLGANLTLRSATGGISLRNTVNGPHHLQAELGSTGRLVFNAAVGGSTALASLGVGSLGQTFINANITTTGNQTYGNSVLFGTQGVAQFVNGNFETGNLSGWDVFNSRATLGSTAIGGFTSPMDTQHPSQHNLNATWTGTFTTNVSNSSANRAEGTWGAVMSSSGNCGTGYCIIRGPYVVSQSTVALSAGDSVSFQWKAEGGSDAFDVYGYLLNTSTGATLQLLNQTGANASATTPWATVSRTMSGADPAGNYRFVFVSGSWDATGGRALGARLLIDDVRTQSAAANLFTGSNCSTCNVTGDQINFNGSVSLGANAVITNAGASAINGAISGSGALTKAGAGTLTLSGANSYAGGTHINAGVLALNHAQALGSSGSIGFGGGVLQHSANNTVDYSARIATTGNQAIRIDTNGRDITYAAALAGANTSLEKLGAGSLILTANGSYTGATTISSGSLVLRNNAPTRATSGFAGPGTLVIEPSGASFTGTGGFATSGWNFNAGSQSLGGLTIGKDGNTSAITLASAATVNGPITVWGNNIDVNARLEATGNTLALNARPGGNIGHNASGSVHANHLALRGNNATLNHAANDVGTLAASLAGTLSYTDANALTIGAAGGINGITATGTVNVATREGDLTLAALVATTSTSASAMRLNAGEAAARGTATGGNLIVATGGSVTVGQGGRATLFSGSIAGSTGLAALVGTGQNRFRYHADETTVISAGSGWLALGSGLHGIFREQPTATLDVGSATITYGDSVPGNVSATFSAGLLHGDSFSGDIAPRVSVVGSNTATSGAWRAGSHGLTALNAGAALGYAVTVNNGSLTVNRRDITADFVAQNRVYDGTTNATVQSSLNNTVRNDVLTLNQSAAFDNRNAGLNKTVDINAITLAGADAGNYRLLLKNADGSTAAAGTTTTTRSATIHQADLVVSLGGGAAGRSMVYNRSTALATPNFAAGAGTTLFSGDTWDTTGASANFNDFNAGTGKTITLAGVSVNDGNSGNNYRLRFETITDGVITPAPLTVTAPTVTKTYDGTTAAWGVSTVAGLVTGDTVGRAATLTFNNANVSRDGLDNVLADRVVTPANIGIIGESSGGVPNANMTGNYTITYVANTASQINPAPLTITANNDAKFVTFGDPTFGVRYSGFVNGETATTAGVLSGTPTVSRTGVGTVEGAGTYLGVLQVTGGAANNYDITRVAGDFTIVPAGELLVRVGPGGLTGITYGETPSYTSVTAQYLLASATGPGTISSSGATVTSSGTDFTSLSVGQVISVEIGGVREHRTVTAVDTTLTNHILTLDSAFSTDLTAGTAFSTATLRTLGDGGVTGSSVGVAGARVTVDDGSGTHGGFNLIPIGGLSSGAGFLRAGAYQLDDQIEPGDIIGPNFNETIHVVGALQVARRGITPVVNAAAATRVYDGSTAMHGLALTPGSGLLGNDDITLSGSGAFTNRNAGTGKEYTVVLNELTGTDAGNYFFTTPTITGTNGVLTPRTLDLSFAGIDKVYDGNTAASVSAIDDRVAGDALTFNRTAVFDSKNVAVDSGGAVVAQGVTLSGVSLSGADANNYTLVATTTGVTARILPRTVTVSGITVADKVYDRSLSATPISAFGNFDNLIAADLSQISVSAAFLDFNAGSNKLVNLGITAAGAYAHNYRIVGQQTALGNITPRTVTVSAGGGVSKVYDGTTAMSGVTLTLSGQLSGDDLTVSGQGAFGSANVGTGLSYTLSNLVLGGAAAANYQFTGGGTTLSGNTGAITARPLNVRFSGIDRLYDGTAIARATVLSDDRIAGDELTFSGLPTGSFADKNVLRDPATGDVLAKSITGIDPSDVTLSGAAAGNYTLVADTTGLTARILPIDLTVSGITGGSRVYDRSTAITLSTTSATLDGLIAGDTITIQGSFADWNVGTDKPVSLSFGGADAVNYNIGGQTHTTASITPRVLTASVTPGSINKVYDGTTTLTNLAFTLNGAIAPDNVSLDWIGSFASIHAGSSVAYSLDLNGLLGADAGNYMLPNNAPVSLTGTGVIAPRAVTLSLGGLSRVFDGTVTYQASAADLAALSAQLGVSSNTVTGIQALFDSHHAGTGRALSFNNAVIDDGNGGNNFAVSFASSNNNQISARPVTLSLGNLSREFDGTVNYQASAADLAALSTQLGIAGTTVTGIQALFDNMQVGTGKTVSFANAIVDDGNNGQNFALSFASSSNNVITRLVTTELDTSLTAALGGGVLNNLQSNTGSQAPGLDSLASGLTGGFTPTTPTADSFAQGGLIFVEVPSVQAGGAGVAAENGATGTDPATQESTQVAGMFETAQHNTLGFMSVFVVDGGVRLPSFAAAGAPGAGTEGENPNRLGGVQVN